MVVMLNCHLFPYVKNCPRIEGAALSSYQLVVTEAVGACPRVMGGLNLMPALLVEVHSPPFFYSLLCLLPLPPFLTERLGGPSLFPNFVPLLL